MGNLSLKYYWQNKGYKVGFYAKAQIYSEYQLYQRRNKDRAALQIAHCSNPPFVDERHIIIFG